MHEPPPAAPPQPVFEIRTATEETLVAMMAPVGAAFGETFTDEEIARERRTWEVDRIFGAYEGERQVGACGNLTFRMGVPGGEVPATGITLIGVLPGERRRGILTAMMRHLVADGRARGEPVAILWASEGAIYHRYGFGLGTLSGSFELAGARAAYVRPVPAEGRVRLVDEGEAAAGFPALFEAARAVTPGMLARSDAWWASLLAENPEGKASSGPKFRVVFEVDGVAEGYAIYRTKNEWDDRGAKGTLTALEVVGTSPRAERELWSWLATLDLYPNLRALRQPVPHPLQLLLAEPRAMALTVTDGIWVRLVDVAPALAARRYGTTGSLVLDVADGFLPENAGRWRMTVDDRRQAVVEPTSDAADLAVDIADLGAVYLGTVRPSELARVGRVTERSAGAVELADRLFGAERAPWCPTMF